MKEKCHADEAHLKNLSTPERKELSQMENKLRLKEMKRKIRLLDDEEKEHGKKKRDQHYTPAAKKIQEFGDHMPQLASMPNKNYDSSAPTSDSDE